MALFYENSMKMISQSLASFRPCCLQLSGAGILIKVSPFKKCKSCSKFYKLFFVGFLQHRDVFFLLYINILFLYLRLFVSEGWLIIRHQVYDSDMSIGEFRFIMY